MVVQIQNACKCNGFSPLRFPGGLGAAAVATAQLQERASFLLRLLVLGYAKSELHFVLNAYFLHHCKFEKNMSGTILSQELSVYNFYLSIIPQ